MRNGFVCMAIVLSFVLAPMASLADDVQNQLQRMEDRMAEMEDRLQATNDQLEAANDVVTRQQEVIDRSGIADQTAGSSGVAAFLDWWPLVYVDLHEMGGNSTYYFPPPAQPIIRARRPSGARARSRGRTPRRPLSRAPRRPRRRSA